MGSGPWEAMKLGKEGKRKIPNVLERAVQALDLPGDAVGMSRIEMVGNRELLVENHRGILEYNEDEIRLNAGPMVLCVRGRGLEVRSMNAQEIALRGEIFAVEFIN